MNYRAKLGEAKRSRNAFLLRCRDALWRHSQRHFDMVVRIASGSKTHVFDLATPERDVIVKCKAFKPSFGLSASLTTLREAVAHLDEVEGNLMRLLIIGGDPHAGHQETLGHQFIRLNRHLLHRVVVLELPETGGALICIHGKFAL